MSWMERVIQNLTMNTNIELSTLLQLQELIDKSPLPDGTDHILSLLHHFFQDGLPTIKAELNQILSKLHLDKEDSSFISQLTKFYGDLEEHLGRDQLLLMTQSLAEVYNQDPTELTIPIKKTVRTDLPKVVDEIELILDLGLEASAVVTVDPRPSDVSFSPPTVSGRYPTLVQFDAQLGLKAGINLAVKPVLLQSSVNGRTQTSLTFRYLNLGSLTWGRVLVDNASRLQVTPFDLGGLARQLNNEQLHSIDFDVNGSVEFGGSVAVATPLSLITGAAAKLDAGVSFTQLSEGQFRFHIDSDPERIGYVRLQVDQLGSTTARSEIYGGLRMDLTVLIEKVRPTLLEHLGSAKTIVDKLTTFSEPSILIREKAEEWLNNQESKPWFNDLVLAVLAVDPSRKPSEVLSDMLLRRFETTTLKWEGSLDEIKTQLTEDLSNRLNLTDTIAKKLDNFINEAVSDFFAKANKEIKGFIESDRNYKKVIDAWDEAGRRINTTLDNPEQRATHLRELLQRIQERLGTTMLRVEEATEVRLAAKLSTTEALTDRRETELTLLFKARSGKRKTQEAWSRTLTGDIANVVQEYAGNRVDADIQVIGGRLTSFLERSRTSGLEAVLLDFRLAGTSILNSNVRIESDPWGNVQVVTSSAKVSSVFDSPWTQRKLELFEAHRLVLASRVGGIELKTVFNHKEERLDTNDIKKVLRLFKKRALVDARTVQDVMAFWENHPGNSKAGELVIRLDLRSTEVERMLALDRSTAVWAEGVRRIASNELGWAFNAHFARKHNPRYLLKFLHESGMPDNWPDIIYQVDKNSLWRAMSGVNGFENVPMGFHTEHDLRSALIGVEQCIIMVDKMVAALLKMREMYGLADRELDWDAARWTRELDQYQHEIANSMESWVKVSTIHTMFDQVRPQTIALFRALTLLAGRQPAEDTNLLTIGFNLANKGMKVLARST
jgi:hypothetical protein